MIGAAVRGSEAVEASSGENNNQWKVERTFIATCCFSDQPARIFLHILIFCSKRLEVVFLWGVCRFLWLRRVFVFALLQLVSVVRGTKQASRFFEILLLRLHRFAQICSERLFALSGYPFPSPLLIIPSIPDGHARQLPTVIFRWWPPA